MNSPASSDSKIKKIKKEEPIPSGRAAPTSKSPESPNAGATWAGEGGRPGMSVHDPCSCIVLMMTIAMLKMIHKKMSILMIAQNLSDSLTFG